MGQALTLQETFKAFDSKRELWQWEVASHNTTTKSYIVALQSRGKPWSPSFDGKAKAFQCLEAYAILSMPGRSAARSSLAQHSRIMFSFRSYPFQVISLSFWQFV